MFEGNILKAGTPEELAKDEMVRKVYLGQNFELRKKKSNFKNIFDCAQQYIQNNNSRDNGYSKLKQ